MRKDSAVFRAAVPVAIAAAIAAAPLAAGDDSRKPTDIRLDATVENLDNGLKVILLEDHSVPVISYHTFFRVGGRNEFSGITGISHFMEHMMFNGAEKYGPKEYDAILESSGGYSNAFTSNDMTAYFEDMSSDGLELLIDLDTDRMKSLALDPGYLKSEMGVVMEERRLSIDNSISGQMWEDLSALAFKAHPYQWPVLGWMSDLEGIDREDCVKYFRTYYAPNNAVLIVAGDFDAKKAMEMIRAQYGPIPAQEQPKPVRTREPEQLGERRAELHKVAELPEVLIAYHGPSVASEDVFALDVLDVILSFGESSRLNKILVRETQAALEVFTSFEWGLDPQLLTFGIKMRPGRTTLEGEKAVYSILDEIAAKGVSAGELEKAKNILEANFVRSLSTVNGKASKIGKYELMFGDFRMIENISAKYRAVTSDQIRDVAGKYFNSKNRNVVTLIPEESES